MIDTVLFDLDGTLLDTAPDIAAALNQVLEEHGHPPQALASLRPHIARGAAPMIEYAFGLQPDAPEFDKLLKRALTLYGERYDQKTQLFPGMATVLDTLDHHTIVWGICTNKAARFTDPVLAAFGLDRRAACVVSGDTLAVSKPQPQPLWHALAQCGRRAAHRTLFVGDAITDIQAGQNAGMATVAALYGYLHPDDNARAWPADYFIEKPLDLLDILNLPPLS